MRLYTSTPLPILNREYPPDHAEGYSDCLGFYTDLRATHNIIKTRQMQDLRYWLTTDAAIDMLTTGGQCK